MYHSSNSLPKLVFYTNTIKNLENRDIFRQLKLLAALMELHDENSFKIRGYQSAIFNLEKFESPLKDLTEEELSALEGVGKGIAKTIHQLTQSGTTDDLQSYKENTPEGIIELLDLKGIGPKKIKVLWKELGIESGYELKEAAATGKVAALKGFGEKHNKQYLIYWLLKRLMRTNYILLKQKNWRKKSS